MNENTQANDMTLNLNNPVIFNPEDAEKILERIESFNPRENLRKIETESGVSFYLDTKDRINWFKKTFPYSKIYKIPKEITETHATFEVRVYVDRNDPYENFLANGFATRYKDESNADYGANFVESAETAALGRALRDAGFGTQSCGMDIKVPEEDERLVDAGMQVKENAGIGSETTVNVSTDNGIPDVSAVESPKVKKETSKTQTKMDEDTAKAPKPIKLTKDMTVEELVKQMNVEYAEKLVVDYGVDAGKSLGYLNQSKPSSLEFHASCSKNNLIKAGALILIAEKKKAE